MLMTLAENENIVASTCAGVILAIRTNGGRMKRAMTIGKNVELVKATNAKSLMPMAIFHRLVKIRADKAFRAMKLRQSLARLRVSHSLMNL